MGIKAWESSDGISLVLVEACDVTNVNEVKGMKIESSVH